MALGLLMAVTGMALIISGMQPKAAPVTPGGGTGPSRGAVSALRKSARPAKRRSSTTSGCPMLRVPKVRLAARACTLLPTHTADEVATLGHAAVRVLAIPCVRIDLDFPKQVARYIVVAFGVLQA